VAGASWLGWAVCAAQAAADAHGGKRDIFEVALDLGLWTVVVFVLLLIILKKFAWGPMLEGLKKREENLHAALEEARAARQEAARLREYLDQEKAKMGEQVREAIDEARRDAARMAEDMKAQARVEIQADRERLRREIELARDQALAQLWQQTAQLATLVASKAIHRQLDADDHRRLVEEALAELKQAGQEWQRESVSAHA
jgi:F-type H+-transporting ATPase subunit b